MIRGSCLCGGIRFEISGRVTPIQICHARRCQKTTGSAFAPEAACRADRFRWTAGEDLIQVYEAPLLREPPPLRRDFCRVCGSPVPVVREDSDFVGFMVGVLDDDPGSRPFRHIFLGQRAAWDELSDDLPRFDERPPADQRLPQRRSS